MARGCAASLKRRMGRAQKAFDAPLFWVGGRGKERRSGTRAILTSGYTAEVLGDDDMTGIEGFLQKPYDQAALARTIRATLDET